ncbi:hypothetical protein NPIL_34121 [Nephila pilipes]|uniref:Uncharacterized protein n=1 Tax=Nephila pilipes TaxID=299642 RepID=A0A8X6P5V4_NEPPI|nr:hypothetical protein NPIL_34121 [Nephila pilipes]
MMNTISGGDGSEVRRGLTERAVHPAPTINDKAGREKRTKKRRKQKRITQGWRNDLMQCKMARVFLDGWCLRNVLDSDRWPGVGGGEFHVTPIVTWTLLHKLPPPCPFLLVPPSLIKRSVSPVCWS